MEAQTRVDCWAGSEEFGVRGEASRARQAVELGVVLLAGCAGRRSNTAMPAVLSRLGFPSRPPQALRHP